MSKMIAFERWVYAQEYATSVGGEAVTHPARPGWWTVVKDGKFVEGDTDSNGEG